MRGIDIYEDSKEPIGMDEFIHTYQPLVMKIAKYHKRRLPSHIEYDDLLQSGFIGLLEAKRTFRNDKGASFETYATHKIRGAIIDSLRKFSWGTREGIKNIKRIAKAMSDIEQRTQHTASSDQIAQELGLDMEEYLKISHQVSACYVVNIEDHLIADNEENNPAYSAEYDDMKGKIMIYLSILPERERLVLSLYYNEELTFKQIGEVLDLTEARICQLHGQALVRIKQKLEQAALPLTTTTQSNKITETE